MVCTRRYTTHTLRELINRPNYYNIGYVTCFSYVVYVDYGKETIINFCLDNVRGQENIRVLRRRAFLTSLLVLNRRNGSSAVSPSALRLLSGHEERTSRELFGHVWTADGQRERNIS